MMQKASFQDNHVLHITDFINNKVAFTKTELNHTREEGDERHDEQNLLIHRPRTMSDPLSSEYYRQSRRNRYPESFGRVNSCCKNREKHTNFANSKQIAQSIYPDFLSSLPNENPVELKKKVKKLLSDSENRIGGEFSDVSSKGPTRKSLLAWYRREYGLSFDEGKANIA